MPSAGLGGVGPQAAGVQHGFMCDGGGSPTKVAAILPRPAEGTAVDPIALEAVDEVVITTLVDNSYDALMGDIGPARRAPFPAVAGVPAPQFEEGRTYPGLIAEHGFSALVTTRRGATAHTVLFDTGVSPDGMASNFERLGLEVAAIEVVVLSHGHADHDGGFPGLARLRGRSGLPLTVHPLVWSRRRLALPDQAPWELPTLSRSALEAEGLEVIERRQPSLLLDGSILITGEVDRTTEFERGLPYHEAWRDGRWEPDPLILDEQALVVHVRGRGLVVLTGCGPRRCGEHRPARDAADRCGPAACPARRFPPHRTGLRARHRAHRGCGRRHGSRCVGARALHGLEGSASACGGAAHRIRAERGRHVLHPGRIRALEIGIGADQWTTSLCRRGNRH